MFHEEELHTLSSSTSTLASVIDGRTPQTSMWVPIWRKEALSDHVLLLVWEEMHKDIMHFVQNCTECTIVSGGRKTVHSPLHPIPVQRPFQIPGADIMDLPLMKQGNRHILVFQDHFSNGQWFMLSPTKKCTTLLRYCVTR